MGARLGAVIAACFVTLIVSAPPANAAFRGENGKIVFQSTREDIDPSGCIARFSPPCDWEIYVMNADGSGQTRLTAPPGFNGVPTWSPDGTRLAFVSLRDGNGEIYAMQADGTGQTRLTVNPAVDTNPGWSPDGSRIVFASTRDNSRGEIYVMNADGTGVTRLTSNTETDREPVWSPDGRKIAFQRQVCDIDFGCAGDIFTMNVDGTGETDLTNTLTEHDELPEWSPDGGTIAYYKNFETVGLVNRDGSGVRPMPGAAPGDSEPAWSPDGTKVAVGANEFEDVVVTNLEDGTRQTLTPSGAFETSPDWQPILNRPPECSGVAADPSVLWPPNRRLRLVELTGASDPDGDSVTLEITGVTQDERLTSGSDALPVSDSSLRLRAKRDPSGDGRVYRVTFTVTDAKGAECQGTATVSVPRHKDQVAVDSAPPSYDSSTR